MKTEIIKVLIIEDNSGDARLIKEMLIEEKDLSFNIENTPLLSSSLEYVSKETVDVILLDLSLPDSFGIDTFEKVYAQAPNVSIIIMTGNDDKTVALDAVNKGAQDYLVKGEINAGILVRSIRYSISRKNAEEKLRKSEEKFRSLVETTPDWIWEVDKKGVFTYASPRIRVILGYEPEEVIGKTPFDFMPEDNVQQALEFFKTTSQAKQAFYGYKNTHSHKDKRPIVIETDGSPIFNDRGELIGYRGINRDITKRTLIEKELKASEKKFRQFFDIEPEYCYIISPEGVIIDVNNTALKALGYRKEEMVGKSLKMIYAPESLSKMKLILRKWQETKDIKNEEMVIVTKNGDRRIVLLNVATVQDEDGKILHSISVQNDITEKKKREVELKKALVRAKESDRLKSAFLANMSHEIRTPLNPIVGFSDLMLGDDIPDEHREYLNIIKNSVNLLLAIINDILDLSKIESDQVEIEQIPLSLEIIFKNLDSTYKAVISQKQRDITLRESFPDNISKFIISDPTRIQQILNNLMSNAVKFTDSGFIEYGVRLRDENRLEFYVRDTGIGIAEDKLKEIFRPFLQADVSHTRKYGGTGLGLTISKKLVELLGGEIKLVSSIGDSHGSTFYFTIPYKPIETETKKTNNIVKGKILENKTNYTILIAEDDIVNQQVVKNILEKSGYNVILSNDGKEAISVYKSDSSIDLILMDIQMPVLDGHEATKVIRDIETQEQKERIPIIALTAYAMLGDRKKCLECGMDDYISKPLRKNKLLESIEKIIKQA